MAASPRSSEPLSVFYSYSHKDERFVTKLMDHLGVLQRQGVICNWHDRKITAGSEWEGQIDNCLNTAGVILLMVSADFLASNYCYDVELKRAMERHESNEARVIPVILRPVDNWQVTPFGKLQAAPTGGRPVTSWSNRDQAFADVAGHIRKAVDELRNP
jgi:hypothetical protein